MRVFALFVVVAGGCGSSPSVATPTGVHERDGIAGGLAPAAAEAGDAGVAGDASEAGDAMCDGEDGLVARMTGPVVSRWDHHLTMAGEGPVELHWCGAGAVDFVQVQVVIGQAGTWQRELDRGAQRASRGRPVTVMVPGVAGAGEARLTAIAIDDAGGEHRAEATVVSIDDPARTAARAACTACGGAWGSVGMSATETCDCPTHDGGTRCTASSQCESVCIATGWEPAPPGTVGDAPCGPGERREELVGQCHGRQHAFGCRPRLTDARSECVATDPARAPRRRLPMVCAD